MKKTLKSIKIYLLTFTGLLKTEEKITSGNYYGLSPKAYILQSETKKKLSHKGVPKSADLHQDHFRKCLYENDPGSVSYSNITISKTLCHARTNLTEKRALNNLYMKLHVEENKISVRPHMRNGQYL